MPDDPSHIRMRLHGVDWVRVNDFNDYLARNTMYRDALEQIHEGAKTWTTARRPGEIAAEALGMDEAS